METALLGTSIARRGREAGQGNRARSTKLYFRVRTRAGAAHEVPQGSAQARPSRLGARVRRWNLFPIRAARCVARGAAHKLPGSMTPADPHGLALVMSGGGARAAYQVGLLRTLARRHPELAPAILTGVSAGAINAASLAANTGPFPQKVEELVSVWSELTTENVFHVETGVLVANALRSALKLASGGFVRGGYVRSLVDTAPLRALLTRVCRAGPDGRLPGIAANLESGALHAIAITAASYSTGQSFTFVQGREVAAWQRAHRRSVLADIDVEHVMASSALPIFFPAIEIGGQWFGDGGMRLTAPLSPAVHLGARKIIAISTRYARTRAEADVPVVDDYPPPAQVLGVLFNAIFLDQFDADALTLERVNTLIAALPDERRTGLRPLRLLVLRPSRDLGKLANEHEPDLPRAFRFMTRGLGTRETRSNDMLSLVMFQRDYIARLVELGERDAEARASEIEAFLAEPV